LDRFSPCVRWFIFLQPIVFFWGWFGFWMLPVFVGDMLFLHTSDREGFVDVPFISIMGQGAWFWACSVIYWKIHDSMAVMHNTATLPIPKSA
jgi:hypothetical protein